MNVTCVCEILCPWLFVQFNIQSPVVVTEDEQSLSDSDAEAVTETHNKKDSPKPKKAIKPAHRAIMNF